MPHRKRTPSPEQRVRQQLLDVHREVLKGLRAVDKAYPNSNRADRIRNRHEQQITKIVRQGRGKQATLSPARRQRQSTELWTDSLPLKFTYAFAIACLFALFGILFEFWALLIFPIGWAVSQSFLWTITVPLSMLLLVIFILSLFGL
jgi:hypothetical protein